MKCRNDPTHVLKARRLLYEVASLEVVKKACFGNDGFSESDTQGEPYYTR